MFSPAERGSRRWAGALCYGSGHGSVFAGGARQECCIVSAITSHAPFRRVLDDAWRHGRHRTRFSRLSREGPTRCGKLAEVERRCAAGWAGGAGVEEQAAYSRGLAGRRPPLGWLNIAFTRSLQAAGLLARSLVASSWAALAITT